MVTKAEMLYQHVIEGISREDLVDLHDTNMDRVRGTLSKAWADADTVENTLTSAITHFNGQGSYRLGQQNIIDDSTRTFEDHRASLKETGGTYLAVFSSDKHLPYVRVDAFMLELQILEAIGEKVAYWSSLNDMFDFAEHGKWDVEPHEMNAIYQSDIGYVLRLADIIHMAVKRRAPYALLLGLTGNHDIRIFRRLRKEMDGYSEKRVLEFMTEMQRQGVLMFSNSSQVEPIIRLSDGLKWVHGISASKLDSTITKNAIEKAKGSPITGDEGVLYHTVSGHVHRSFVNNYMGVTHANAGCGCSLTPSYMKHEPAWNLGIVISEFDAGGRGVNSVPVDFIEKGNELIAQYKGQHFSVPLKPDRFVNL